MRSLELAEVVWDAFDYVFCNSMRCIKDITGNELMQDIMVVFASEPRYTDVHSWNARN